MRTVQWVTKFHKLNAPPTDREPEPIPDLVQPDLVQPDLVQREPNPDDAPYRPPPIPNPGKPPWPGYPKPPKIASHDNRQFKSVPATGLRGDQPASPEFIEGHLPINDKSLLDIQNDINMEKV